MGKITNKCKKILAVLGLVVATMLTAVIVYQLCGKIASVGIAEPFTTEKPIEEQVEPLWANIDVELGAELDQDIKNYIEGDEDAIAKATLDLSKVNKDVMGCYEAYVNIGERTIAYEINVVDTLAPELVLNTGTMYLAQGREYSADYFVESVYDLSGDVTPYILLEDRTDSIIKYDKSGKYWIKIGAKDSSGNEITKTICAVVDEAPKLIGVREIAVKKSTEYDFSKDIVALDNLEGDITEKIVVNTEEVDLATAGEYKVIYTVVDSYGIETSQTAIVTVCDDEPLNNGTIDSFTQEEMEALCEFEYFSYEPLKEENYEQALKLVEPTLVSVYCSKGAGAGYIYKITPEYIYIVTEKHVMTRNEDYTFVFFDKETVTAPGYHRLSLNTKKSYATDAGEIVLYRIKTSDVPKATMLKIKQTYYDKNITYSLYNNQNVFVYTKWYNKCAIENLIKKLTITDTKGYWKYKGGFLVIETTLGCISGQSGSPTYDYKGNLVGMIYGGSSESDYHLFIDELENFDERFDEFDKFEE